MGASCDITNKTSPSGRYTLEVSAYATRPGAWNYTRGVIRRASDGELIAEVNRNFSSFPHLFVEDHGGHDYLVCGEDYQGQTVVQLDTGVRRDYLPEEAKKGIAFCWADYTFNAELQLLVVQGCHWACPYEIRFYNFSDPMVLGWPEIAADECIDDDEHRPPEISNGEIRCFQTHRVFTSLGKREMEVIDDESLSEEQRFDDANYHVVVDVETVYRCEGAKLVKVSELVSEEELAWRERQEKARLKYERELAEFKANDPLYLRYLELVKEPHLSPEDYESVGITHDGWCALWSGKERRWCRRIVNGAVGADGVKRTIDLEWATVTGPIKIELFENGKRRSSTFFSHSVNDMEKAFQFVRELLGV